MSEVSDPAPWLDLKWDSAVRIGRVTLVFDTGLHRYLTFALNNGRHKTVHWGAQPETVKEFKIYTEHSDGRRTEVAHIEDNYQRQVQIECELSDIKSLRVEVLATNGLDHARIVELYCEG
jgi:hypothetical protein